MMSTEPDLESVCSVTEMARAVGLSRARFYQLIKAGAFPPPVYCILTRRPIYPLSLQRMCLRIRSTSLGFDERPTRFNARRKTQPAGSRRQKAGRYKDLAEILEALGVRVPDRDVIEAVGALYPRGLRGGPIEATVVHSVLCYLQGRCQNNV